LRIDQFSAAERHPPLTDGALGRVLAVTGAQATVRLPGSAGSRGPDDPRATVGKFVGLRTHTSQIVGVITQVDSPSLRDGDEHRPATGQADLLGEIKHRDDGTVYFQRGITEYPVIGDTVEMVTPEELRLIYTMSGPAATEIGHLQQDATVAASINVDEMLRKHFAIFGTTGVGKSSGVALLLGQTLATRDDLRIFLIDPHNEYGRCFGDRSLVLSPVNLKLPFWLFNFEETVDVFFRGRPGAEEEVEILSEVIPQAKAMFAGSRSPETASLRKIDAKSTGFVVDTPVPYRLSDLIGLIDERMGKLENRNYLPRYHRLISRIETVRNDPRYAFMFDNANVGGDTMVEVLSMLFRLPTNGKPMTVMQLAGFPSEVVDSVVSVLARMAFEFGLWSDGAAPLLFVCEEAHRYAPADRTMGFGPTRKALSRIAKEGRKYGVFLGLVTQRPAELDATIISQCSTVFAMRMANDRDQAIVRASVSDAAASLISFVPSLGTREVFAFGEAVALPTRLRFKRLEPHQIPKSEAVGRAELDPVRGVDKDFITSVVERWRGAMMAHKIKAEPIVGLDESDDFESAAAQEFLSVSKNAVAPEYEPANPLLKPSSPFTRPVVSAPPQPPAPPRPAASLSAGTAQAFAAELAELRNRLRGGRGNS
jgi:DNA helicase HerA-like ATPase